MAINTMNDWSGTMRTAILSIYIYHLSQTPPSVMEINWSLHLSRRADYMNTAIFPIPFMKDVSTPYAGHTPLSTGDIVDFSTADQFLFKQRTWSC